MSKQAKAVAKKAVKAVKATATKIEKKLTTAIKATKRRAATNVVPQKIQAQVAAVKAIKAVKARKVTQKELEDLGMNPTEYAAFVGKKGAAVKVATKVVEVKSVAPEVTGPKNPRALIISMLMERQYTDDEIHAEVVKQFGDDKYTTKKAYIQLTRGDVNCGNVKHILVDGSLTTYVNRIVLNEKGEKVEVPYKPSNLRKAELQFDLQQ